jgi:hypothetical protein
MRIFGVSQCRRLLAKKDNKRKQARGEIRRRFKKGKNNNMNPKKKHNIVVQREHKIYGKTFLIPLINFLVASSCWYFLISAHFHAYKTRHVKVE